MNISREEIIAMARDTGVTLPAGPFPERVAFTLPELLWLVRTVVVSEREACVQICDEMQEHYSALKDTALLNGDIDLSNTLSGEPRACEFLSSRIRARGENT